MTRFDGSKVVLALLLLASLIWGRFFFRLIKTSSTTTPKNVNTSMPLPQTFTVLKPLETQALSPFLWEPFRQKDLRPKTDPPSTKSTVAPTPAPPFPWRYVGTFQKNQQAVYLFLGNNALTHLLPGSFLGPWQLEKTEEDTLVFKAEPNHEKRVPK